MKYFQDILDANNFESFSSLITKIASIEGYGDSDLEQLAKLANDVRIKNGMEAI